MDDVRKPADGVNETWKPVAIEPFGTAYECSDLGNVRRIGSAANLKASLQSRGYLMIGIYVPGAKPKKQKMLLVHRIVAATFLEPSDNLQVNHKDGDKRNNAVSNLEWCTQSENMRHARAAGLYPPGHRSYAKLSEGDAMAAIKLMLQGVTDKRLGEVFGVSESTIRLLRIGTTWASLQRPAELADPKRGAKTAERTRRAAVALRRFLNARMPQHPRVGTDHGQPRTSEALPESAA